jgi:ABC-type lipoprotein release transport system permease subunit
MHRVPQGATIRLLRQLRARRRPELSASIVRWVGLTAMFGGALFVVGSLAMLGFNDQNAQALLAIPNGIAWVAVGYVLWSGGDDSTRRRRQAPR